MNDDQVKGIARAINPHWWNDDIDLLDFSRALLARVANHDEALLRQAMECLERSDCLGYQANLPVIAAIKERLK